MRRVVSVYLPHWSTDRLRRKTAKPPPDGHTAIPPLITAIPDHGRRIVAAVDAGARALGITPGMTVTKARSFAHGLDVIDADPEADSAGLRRLALWAGQRYSPVVAPDLPDGLWLDITGCASLFDTERALVKDLHRRIAAFGLSVQIAVADTAGCAHAVARHVPAGRPVTIEPGDHRNALGLLPIVALRLESGIVEGLRKLGFERIEQLIGTPRGPLAKRFGRTLHRRLDQALGHVPEPIEPVFPEALPRARRGFMEPLLTAEAFGQVIADLAADISEQLIKTASGARRLDCHFHRVDGHSQAIRVGTATPSRDSRHLAKLLAAKIETIDPGLGIEVMTLIASLVEPLGPGQREGLESMVRRGPDLSALVDALANRFGQRRLYRSTPHPSAMPERSLWSASPLSNAEGAVWNADLPRPSRMLSSPEPVDVTAMLPDHPPAMFVWRRKRYRVAQADGPERLHGEWWRDGGVEADRPYTIRDYFQVETTEGGRYWLFRLGDGENPATGPMRWFIHGAFA
ncbi:DNA polymerase Y family protein [Sphingomonas donggukensis]|uniref:DNA polymerase Y family protein n=1 Tax=Sphingomonas donggukensis TaxID=2949093 RepID=A0ABY4TU27_9SPHN|nr:DNA polymerase Y family protein [Sphingomonas donggukensis]URW75908.1 DNA polymerase Y family protein [Sphingomonas donggukensis]